MIRFLTARFSRQVIGLTLSATIPILVAGIWVLNKTAAGHLRSAAVERLASAADILARRVDAWGGAVARNLQLLSSIPIWSTWIRRDSGDCFSSSARSTPK